MTEVLAPTMFLCLVIALFAGFPVAFSLSAVAGVFGVIGITAGHFKVAFLTNMLFRIQGTFNNDNLLALPLLIFMGMLLERTGIAEDMFVALNRLFGRLSGGLSHRSLGAWASIWFGSRC